MPKTDNFSQAAIKQAFDNGSANYDEAAVVHKEVGERMIERLQYVNLEPDCVLDLGCNTGRFTRALKKKFKSAQVIAFDLAPKMLELTKQRTPWLQKRKTHFVNGDAMSLPFADDSMDLIFSALVFHWVADLSEVLKECARVLKPGGVLVFATFGPDTLRECRTSFAKVDDYRHVLDFTDMHDVGDALVASGFAEPVLDVEYFKLMYPSVRALLGEIKAMGANNHHGPRRVGLTGKHTFAQFIQHYQQDYQEGNHIPATYEVVYGQAFATEPHIRNQRNAEGDVVIPVRELLSKK